MFYNVFGCIQILSDGNRRYQILYFHLLLGSSYFSFQIYSDAYKYVSDKTRMSTNTYWCFDISGSFDKDWPTFGYILGLFTL